jgi:hypothetical protein
MVEFAAGGPVGAVGLASSPPSPSLSHPVAPKQTASKAAVSPIRNFGGVNELVKKTQRECRMNVIVLD